MLLGRRPARLGRVSYGSCKVIALAAGTGLTLDRDQAMGYNPLGGRRIPVQAAK